MRNPDRTHDFCNTFATLWAKELPDWRFGQLISNFFGWIYSEKKIDPFFPEEDKMLELFKEFLGVKEN